MPRRLGRWSARSVWAAGAALLALQVDRLVLVVHSGPVPVGPAAAAAAVAAAALVVTWRAAGSGRWWAAVACLAPWGVWWWVEGVTCLDLGGGVYLVDPQWYRDGCHRVVAELADWAECTGQVGAREVPHSWVVDRLVRPVGDPGEWLAAYTNHPPAWGLTAPHPDPVVVNHNPAAWRVQVFSPVPTGLPTGVSLPEYVRPPRVILPPRGGGHF